MSFSPLQVRTGAVTSNFSAQWRQGVADGIVSSDLLFTQSTVLILHLQNPSLEIKILFNLKNISSCYVGQRLATQKYANSPKLPFKYEKSLTQIWKAWQVPFFSPREWSWQIIHSGGLCSNLMQVVAFWNPSAWPSGWISTGWYCRDTSPQLLVHLLHDK